MSRAQKNARRGKGAGKSVQKQPTVLDGFKGNGVRKASGNEFGGGKPTLLPADMADPTARVIKTRS